MQVVLRIQAAKLTDRIIDKKPCQKQLNTEQLFTYLTHYDPTIQVISDVKIRFI